MNLFVFDIETVPDVESGRRLYGLDDRNATAVFTLRAQETGGSGFLRHHLRRIVAISDVSPDSLPSTDEQTPTHIALA
jgi:predicted PolB exonuclease-like 3'-5' exonuclease